MLWVGIIVGFGGVVSCLFYPTLVDSFLFGFPEKLRSFLASLMEAPPHPDDDLYLTSSLIGYLRAGITLDSALEKIALELPSGSPKQLRLRRILLGNPDSDFLSKYLRSAVENGSPALAALTGIERALQSRRKLQLKARGITGHCRAQAEVLSWLPWLLAIAIILVDFSWFLSATRSSIAWAFWAAAVGLSGLGRQWMSKLLSSALKAKSAAEKMEEVILPDFTLRTLSEIAQGKDVETAMENSMQSIGNTHFRELFFALGKPGGHIGGVMRLRGILRQAAQTGAPVRDELLNFLGDHHAEMESRWEERVLRLPVVLLAPLFLCFFPASLLVLAGLLLPLLREAW